MPFRLVSLTDNPDIMLDKPIVLVGRHDECDVHIPSRKISRKHCCIAQVNDYVVVRDLFSTNGVSINGTRVEEGSLKSGDELSIAHFRYQVVFGARELLEHLAVEERSRHSADESVSAFDDDASPLSGPATEMSLAHADPIDDSEPSG